MKNESVRKRRSSSLSEKLGPAQKLAQMIKAAFDSGVIVKSNSKLRKPELNECLVIEGNFKGRQHRVLIDGVSGTVKGSKRRTNRLLQFQKSLGADAVFFCMRSGPSGKVLLHCLESGITPVEYDEESGKLRVHFGKATIVRHIVIKSWSLSFPDTGKGSKSIRAPKFREKTVELFALGKPIRNWLSRESRKLIQMVKEDSLLSAKYYLKKPVIFESKNWTFGSDRLEAVFKCRIQHRVHSLQADLVDLEYNPALGKVLWSGNVTRKRKTMARLAGLVCEETSLLGKKTFVRPELNEFHLISTSSMRGIPDLNPLIQSVEIHITESRN